MKYFLAILFIVSFLELRAQSLEFSIGLDWLYLPEVVDGKLNSPETYAIKYEHKIGNSNFSVGSRLRYSLYPGNNYRESNGNIRLSNYGPGDEKYFDDLDYERGFINYGRFSQRWNYHSLSSTIVLTYEVLTFKNLTLDIFCGVYVDRYFTSQPYLLVNEAEITDPDGNTSTFDDSFYLNSGFISLGNGGGVKLSYDLSDYTFVAIDGELMFFYQGHAYFYSNLSIGYKF